MRKYDFYSKSYKSFPDLTLKKAYEVGLAIGVDFTKFDLGEFRQGVKEEMEHGNLYAEETGGITKVHNDSYETAGKIAIAHLVEMPDYYQNLEDMEKKGEDTWGEGEEKHQKTTDWITQNYLEEAEVLKAAGIDLS